MKNIFSMKKKHPLIRFDPFFIELAIILPVFAICCCAVLKMLAVSSERAKAEEMRASALTLASSYCEVYGVCGSMERSAAEVFADVPEEILQRNEAVFMTDICGRYGENGDELMISVTERSEDVFRDGMIYGVMMYSDITITSKYNEMSSSSCCYKPMAAIIGFGEEEGHE
ncbi:MAG: hypothetical protein ACI4Q6_08520 [Huintestinicola sp.]